MHKIKSLSVLEIRTIQLSIPSPTETSDSVFAGETNALFIHNYLNLLPLSGILHSDILAIFLLYCNRGHDANQHWSRGLTAAPRVWLAAGRLAQNFWGLNAASRNVMKSLRLIRESFLFRSAAALCAVTHSMRIFITESFIVISSNLRPYIGTLRDLGANSTLDGLFVVEKFLHIFTG